MKREALRGVIDPEAVGAQKTDSAILSLFAQCRLQLFTLLLSRLLEARGEYMNYLNPFVYAILQDLESELGGDIEYDVIHRPRNIFQIRISF